MTEPLNAPPRQSVGDLLSDVTRDLSTLLRQEVELAKAEVTQSAKQAAKGGSMFAGAAVAGHFVLLFLSVALWWALGDAMDSLAWSAVIVAVRLGDRRGRPRSPRPRRVEARGRAAPDDRHRQEDPQRSARTRGEELMSTDPDQIRDDIERTRAELSSDVDALTDKVSPTQAAQRQAERVRSAATGVKDRVMGAVSDGADAARGTAASGADRIGSTASAIGDKASDLPHAAASKTRGNPLAAGLIAFGVGWLVSSVAAEHAPGAAAGAVRQGPGGAARAGGEGRGPDRGADNLRSPPRTLRPRSRTAPPRPVRRLRDEGRDAASALRSDASDAADNVKGAHAANDGGQAF